MWGRNEALEHNDILDLVFLFAGKKFIRCKWIYNIKMNPNVYVSLLKTQLVAKGYAQIYGVEYTNTFSHVAKLSSIRITISLYA